MAEGADWGLRARSGEGRVVAPVPQLIWSSIVSRQIAFHATDAEIVDILERSAREHELIVTEVSDSAADLRFTPVRSASFVPGATLALTSRTLAGTMSRGFIPNAANGPYHRIECSENWIELEPPIATTWSERPALISGRFYTTTGRSANAPMAKIFGRIADRIRRRFTYVKECLCYASPGTIKRVLDGAWLLGSYRPPDGHDAWRQTAQSVRERIIRSWPNPGTKAMPSDD